MNSEELKSIVNAGIKLVEKWKLNDTEKEMVLGFNPQKITGEVYSEQEQRLSLLLNIHAELRMTFDNPENYYGYMKMTNHNSPFCGKRPIDLAQNLNDLYSVYDAIKKISKLR